MTRGPGILARLVIVVVLAAVLAGAVGALLLRSQAERTLRAQVLARNVQLAERLASNVDARFDAVGEALRGIAAVEPITLGSPDARAELAVQLRVHPTFDSLVRYDARGNPTAAIGTGEVPDVAELPVRRDLVSSLEPGQTLVLAPGPDDALIEVVTPIEFPTGSVVGAVLGEVRLSELTEALLASDVGNELETAVVTPSGELLAQPATNRRLPLRGPAAGIPAMLDDGLVSAIRAGPEGDHLLSIAMLEDLQGAVVVDQPVRAALATLDEEARGLVLVLLAVVATVVVALLAAGGTLLRPLRPLAEAVTRVRRGERRIRVDVTGSGELRALALEFNRMASALETHVEGLERSNAELNQAKMELEQRLHEIQRARRALAVSTEQFEAAFELAPIGMALVGRDGAFLRVNDALVDLLDRPADALLSEGPAELTDDGDRERHAAWLENVMEHAPDDIVQTDVRFRRPDGTTVWVLATASRITTLDQGDVLFLQLQDITERKRTEAALAEAVRRERQVAAELREVASMKDAFVTAVSHELRTPLAVVRATAESLDAQLDGDADGRLRELVDPLRRNIDRLDRLTEDLLDLDRLRRGVLEPEAGLIPLPEVMDGLLGYLDAPDRQRLTVDVDEAVVSVDRARLERILHNLVGNALKYTPLDAPVSVEMHAVDGEVHVAVGDRGPGIPDDAKPRIFEPFERGPAHLRHAPGTGVGLALVAQFAALHGGRAWVEDRPGGGAVFRVVVQELRTESALPV